MQIPRLLLGLTMATIGCAAGRRELAHPAPHVNPASAFSPAVRANGFLFLAGQLGTDSTGRLAQGGIQPETRQAMENVRAILTRTGSSLDRVVKCTVFLVDMGEWAAMNEVYVTYFPPGRRPARSAVGISGLALDARVEIECLAAE